MSDLLAQLGATIPLDLTIEQEGVGGVGGQAPTVALRDAATTNSYLDFADNLFKTSGWTTKYASMTEIERGHYQRIWNTALVLGLSAGAKFAAEYHNPGPYVGDDLDIVELVQSINDLPGAVADAVWDESSAGHVVVGSMGERQARIDVLVSSRAQSGQGLTTQQATMLLEMYDLLGLDPTKPLIVTSATRKVPADGSVINQTISDIAGVVTVQRL